jgi:mRNA interferase MazF
MLTKHKYCDIIYIVQEDKKIKSEVHKMKEIKRGQVWYADLSPVKGSEQGGVRPVLIIQNNKGNQFAPTTIIAPITSRPTKAKLPTHIWLAMATSGLSVNSMVELEQIRVIDKRRLIEYSGYIQEGEQRLVDEAIKISLEVK